LSSTRSEQLLRKFEQITFVAGNRGSVVKSDSHAKLKKLDVKESKKDRHFADHVIQVSEARDQVIFSFLHSCKDFNLRGQPRRD